MEGREAVWWEKVVGGGGGGWREKLVEGAVEKRGGRAEVEGVEMVGYVWVEWVGGRWRKLWVWKDPPPLMLREVGTKLRELWFVWGCVGGANVGVISELRYAPCK